MDLHFAPEPNPHVIAWARSEGGWPVERVASRLSVSAERVVVFVEREVDELALHGRLGSRLPGGSGVRPRAWGNGGGGVR